MPGHPVRRAAARLALAAALSACASGGGGAPADGAAPADGGAPRAARSTNRVLLVAADFEGSPHTNLFDAVNALRQHWLRPGNLSNIPTSGASNAGTSQQTVVFLNGQQYGGLDALRQLTLETVQSARFLTAPEAQNKYGARVQSAVIDVVLKQ